MRFLLASLAFLLPVISPAAPRAAEDNLARSLAEARRAQIRSVNYKLHFTFAAGQEEYTGRERIELALADTTRPLNLDWKGKIPTKVTVNGRAAKFVAKTGYLEIPAKGLEKNTVIELEFTNDFGKEGDGIQHVVDPEDKAEYVYTDFEPYSAHQLFPCFDQPDLKARFDLTITAPTSWKAIGNSLASSDTPGAGVHTTVFQTTPLLSTYLFFVGAGEYQEWKDQAGKIPLVLYARKSLAKYVDADNLFRTMKKGVHFYNEYFGYEYPFPKFGLVFAPEFSWGGMENPGAIVVNEANLFRGPVPSTRREDRDSLILHELAHHWFGDLVTMKWWNDLWLNESFATYLATLALDREFDSKIAWQNFASEKNWGTWQDQLVTTHPIETSVKDTRSTRGNFDGITYAKGAAALQQLHFYVGEDAFREGVRAYFRQHAFGNAERADFVGTIAKAAGRKLDGWTHAWLQTAGVNRVSVEARCLGGKLSQFTIRQAKSASHTLSPHRTRVGFFRKDGDELTLTQSKEVAYEGAETLLQITDDNPPCPDFVFPNLDDKDYALFALDEKSLTNAQRVLEGGVSNPVLRMQAWSILSQMVRDGALDPIRYFELARAGYARETDEGVLSVVLGRHTQFRDVYHEYMSIEDRRRHAADLEKTIQDRIASAAKGSTPQLLFFDFLVRVAQTPETILQFAQWIQKSEAPAGIELDQERRWNMLYAIASHGYPGAKALLDAEEKRDPSDLGKRMAYAARVSIPDPEAKKAFWKAIEHPEKIPPSTLRQAASGFHQPNYPSLIKPYVKAYFERLRRVDWKKSDQLVHVYFDGLFPGLLCTKTLLRESEAALRANRALSPYAMRAWREANDELARCTRVGRR